MTSELQTVCIHHQLQRCSRQVGNCLCTTQFLPRLSLLDAKFGVFGLVKGLSDGMEKNGSSKLGIGRACSSNAPLTV